MFSGVGTPGHSAVGDALIERDIPDMFIVSGAAKWNYPLGPSTKKTMFGYHPDFITEGKILGKYAVETFKGKTIGVIYQADDLGKDYVTGFEETLKKANAPAVVAKEAIELAATDASGQALKLKDAGAEVLFLAATSSAAGRVMNAAASLN